MVKDPVLRFGLVSSRTKGSGRELLKRGSRSQPRSLAQSQLHGLQGQGTSNHLLGPSCFFETRISQVLQSICCHMASNSRDRSMVWSTTLQASCPTPCSEELPFLPLPLTVASPPSDMVAGPG